MSRKARLNKSEWCLPLLYVFTGDYGPFKARDEAPIDGTLVLLTSTLKDNDDRKKEGDFNHSMYRYAGLAQKILLKDYEDERHSRLDSHQNLLIVDVAAMVKGTDADQSDEKSPADILRSLIEGEMNSSSLMKGFGKPLLRIIQRLHLHNATFVAEGSMCCVLLKLCNELLGVSSGSVISQLYLIHPILPAKFVNNVLVPGSSNSKLELPLHLIFQDEKTRAKRLSMIRHTFPKGLTEVIPFEGAACKLGLNFLLSIMSNNYSNDEDVVYDPEYYNCLGKSLFLSSLSVEMNKYTKQYERITEDITADLLIKVNCIPSKMEPSDVTAIDWMTCERHIGALVLRGNRCVLVRSLTGQWSGMRIPSVLPNASESAIDTAIRSVVEFTGVDASEVMPIKMLSPVTVFAPNGRNIVIELHPLYASSPPPDGPLEDQDMEDEDSPYDWYLFENAAKKLDERSMAAMRTMSAALIEAANVGVLPSKWGGVFGQEAAVTDMGTIIASNRNQLSVKPEDWEPTLQADILQEVRKIDFSHLARKGSGHFKLPVTLLSGFLGAGKTTLMTHILTNYNNLKIAILVNDMGVINIDAALLKKHSVSITQKEEHMVELSNGCICCTLREDLLVEVAKIAAQNTFDYLLIESTGVSEPMPVAETFTFEDSTGLRLGDVAKIDTLVTVVDGSRFLSELDCIQTLRDRDWHADSEDQRTISHLLCDQVEFANVVVLNKCDLINNDETNRVKRLIQQMNPTARLIESSYCKVPLDQVLGTGLFSMSEAEKHDGWLEDGRFGHTPETIEYGISSFIYRARKPFWPHKINLALEDMLNQAPPYDKSIILRSKGIVWLASFPDVQGHLSVAGHHFSVSPGDPWWAEIDREYWPEGLETALKPLWKEPYGDKQQEIVIIGQNLDIERITECLDACLLQDEDLKKEAFWNKISLDEGDPFYQDWYHALTSATNGHDHDHNHH